MEENSKIEWTLFEAQLMEFHAILVMVQTPRVHEWNAFVLHQAWEWAMYIDNAVALLQQEEELEHEHKEKQQEKQEKHWQLESKHAKEQENFKNGSLDLDGAIKNRCWKTYNWLTLLWTKKVSAKELLIHHLVQSPFVTNHPLGLEMMQLIVRKVQSEWKPDAQQVLLKEAWTKLIHQHSRNNLLVHTLDRRYQARLHDQVVVKVCSQWLSMESPSAYFHQRGETLQKQTRAQELYNFMISSRCLLDKTSLQAVLCKYLSKESDSMPNPQETIDCYEVLIHLALMNWPAEKQHLQRLVVDSLSTNLEKHIEWCGKMHPLMAAKMCLLSFQVSRRYIPYLLLHIKSNAGKSTREQSERMRNQLGYLCLQGGALSQFCNELMDKSGREFIDRSLFLSMDSDQCPPHRRR